MGKKAVFLQCTEEAAISKTGTPEFYRLYLESILLALQEQGELDDRQLQEGLAILRRQAL